MTTDKPSRLVPKLRFPEFRETGGWLALQFTDLYNFKRTNTLSRDNLNYKTGTIRNIHYGDVHTKFKPLFRVCDEDVPYVNPDAVANGFDDDAFCEEGDIVLADASEDLDGVGKAIEVVSLDGERVVAGTHTILANRRRSVPVVGFGGQLFQSVTVRNGIKKEAQGAKVYGISANRISTLLVPIPQTEAEQQKIADCLGSLDDLIAAERRKLEALRRYKQGLMEQLFPQEGETVPRLRFPEFKHAPKWTAMAFEHLYDFKPTNSYSRAQLNYDTGDVLNVHYGDIHTRYGAQFRVADEVVPYVNSVELPDRINPEALCKEGDIVFADASEDLADVGKSMEIVELSGKRVLSGSHTILARPRNFAISVGFGAYLFKSGIVRAQIEREAQGTKVMSISPARLSRITILFPSEHEEQRRITACLASLDVQIGQRSERLDALGMHKQGLLQQLFPSLEGREQ